MNPSVRQFLTDVKAAARIGHPASLETALQGLHQFPEVAANAPFGEDFLQQVILPLGRSLAASRLDSKVFQLYVKSPHAAWRALAAVACAVRYFDAPDAQRPSLDRLAADTRPDVRRALAMGLSSNAVGSHPELSAALHAWLTSDSPRLQQTAVSVIAHLTPEHIRSQLPALTPLIASPDPELRAALAEALIQAAQKDLSSKVLSLLQEWSLHDFPNSWVITRVLSGSWAAAHTEPVLDILYSLARSGADEGHIATTLKALIRHGAGDAVHRELDRWRRQDDPTLRSLAERLTHQP